MEDIEAEDMEDNDIMVEQKVRNTEVVATLPPNVDSSLVESTLQQ